MKDYLDLAKAMMVINKAKEETKEQQIVHCVVIEPETDVTPEGDFHGDVMSAEEIEKTAHSFALRGFKLKIQHQGKPVKGMAVIESYIAPVEFEINGHIIKEGSWVIAIKVASKRIWKAIKEGKFTGVSPGGFGTVIEEN